MNTHNTRTHTYTHAQLIELWFHSIQVPLFVCVSVCSCLCAPFVAFNQRHLVTNAQDKSWARKLSLHSRNWFSNNIQIDSQSNCCECKRNGFPTSPASSPLRQCKLRNKLKPPKTQPAKLFLLFPTADVCCAPPSLSHSLTHLLGVCVCECAGVLVNWILNYSYLKKWLVALMNKSVFNFTC